MLFKYLFSFFSDLELGTPAKLANFIKNCSLPFTKPSFQKTNFCLMNTSDACSDVYYSNPSFQVILPEIPAQRKQELIFPVHSPSLSTFIGDPASCELTIGDVKVTTTLHCKRILKIRHKKMKKHKYRKRRKRDLYKRRNLKILRERRKKSEKREEERKIEWEKAHAD